MMDRLERISRLSLKITGVLALFLFVSLFAWALGYPGITIIALVLFFVVLVWDCFLLLVAFVKWLSG